MKIVAISDTHLRHPPIPDGDLVIHAGDWTLTGTIPQFDVWVNWYGSLPHKHKVAVAGNHDFIMEKSIRSYALDRMKELGIIYLEDSVTQVGHLSIYGSPYTPKYYDWAFMLPRNRRELEEKWSLIPSGLDILITHGMPYGILDPGYKDPHVGCEKLREAVFKVKPRVVVGGHLHAGYGVEVVDGVKFINASVCNEHYLPVNKPIVFDLD